MEEEDKQTQLIQVGLAQLENNLLIEKQYPPLYSIL